ncbi:MAG TPA: response regulator [Chitinophagaceae bacterium]|nr:response regulator [Chitinophagaceae bacterium]
MSLNASHIGTRAEPVQALIVDDEKDICYLLAHILEQKNIRSRQVNTLTDAEKVLDEQAPPVIFLDNHLPDGLGINRIKEFRSKAPRCKIIMITAHDNPSDRVKAREEGADFFIGKPFTKDLIFNTLEKIV